jgi:hypothetical protein
MAGVVVLLVSLPSVKTTISCRDLLNASIDRQQPHPIAGTQHPDDFGHLSGDLAADLCRRGVRGPRLPRIAAHVNRQREIDGHGGGLDAFDALADPIVGEHEVLGAQTVHGTPRSLTATSTKTTSVRVRNVCGGFCGS